MTTFRWAGLGLVIAFGSAQAQDEALKKRIENLERKVEKLEQTNDQSDGFALRDTSGLFKFRLRARIQVDGRFYLDDDEAETEDTFVTRRVRPTFQGRIGELVGFRITTDFAEGEAELVYGFVELYLTEQLTLIAGQYKQPISLEDTRSSSSLSLVERAFPASLTPTSDIALGLQAALGSTFLYFGVGNGTPDGRDGGTNDDGNFELYGRVFAKPFNGALSGLGIGIAGSYGKKEQRNPDNQNAFLPRYRSPGQNVVFRYAANTLADGDHTRVVPQAYYFSGPFGLLTEYAQTSQEVRNGGAAADLDNRAWQVTANYVLTGEDASFGGVDTPAQPIGAGGWGAWEIAARYAHLDVDDDAFPIFANPAATVDEADTIGIGLNWYLNSVVRVSLAGLQTSFEGGAPGGDREDETVILSRLQLNF